jgi:hypothetical protein
MNDKNDKMTSYFQTKGGNWETTCFRGFSAKYEDYVIVVRPTTNRR